MAEPRTEAGREALRRYDGNTTYDGIRAMILAVEDELTAPPTSPRRTLDELLIWAVDLRAVAHNAILTLGGMGGLGSDRFWRKMHELREAVNHQEHEDLRIEYVRAVTIGRDEKPDLTPSWMARHHDIDERFNSRCLHDATTDCAGQPRLTPSNLGGTE